MRKHTPPKELVGFLEPYAPGVRELALAVRDAVLAELVPCHENMYDAYNAVALGYGPSERLRDAICHIAVYPKHVNLGFNRGALMADPHGLLAGTGKWIRHITFKTVAELAQPAVRQYLRQARAQAEMENPVRAQGNGVTSVVRAVYARRRR